MPTTRNGTSQDTSSRKGDGDEESSASEEDSCSYDEGETEKRKYRCLDDMLQLEKQFSEMNELLYKERMQDIDQKMNLITEDSAPEYTNPVKELKDATDQRLKAVEILLDCKTTNIKNKYEQEFNASELDYKNSCMLTKLQLELDIEDKMNKLEKEALTEVVLDTATSRKRKFKPHEFLMLEKRKKPVVVTGPCVVYMLKDIDIMEDINEIRKGIALSEVKAKNS